MRPTLWLLCVVVSFAGSLPARQQGHPEPYPTGVFCTPKGKLVRGKQTTDEPCKCKRHDDGNPDNPYAKEMCKAGEPVNPSHDPVCRQECQEQHCMCPVSCDVPRHPHE